VMAAVAVSCICPQSRAMAIPVAVAIPFGLIAAAATATATCVPLIFLAVPTFPFVQTPTWAEHAKSGATPPAMA
jgi:hypothetical protein